MEAINLKTRKFCENIPQFHFNCNSLDGDKHTAKYRFILCRAIRMMRKLAKNKELRIWPYIQFPNILLGVLTTQLASVF